MRTVAFGIGLAAGLGVVSVAAANLDDQDAPMITARYVAAAAPVAVAAPDPAEAAAQISEPASIAPIAAAATPHARRRFDLALDEAKSNVEAVAGRLTGLAADARLHREALAELNRFSAPAARMAQDQNLRRGFGEMQAVGEKARLFLFAGDQGGVWSYNFTRDSAGVRAAGWTTEAADQDGRRRIGLAWQKGRARIALTGMERKFCQFGMELKDRVVAMSISFSPGWSSHRDRQSG